MKRGTLDILFANAGTEALVPLTGITSEHYDETLDVNVKKTIYTAKQDLKLMGDAGLVILTGSTTGVMGTLAFSVYNSPNAVVRNLGRSWTQVLRSTVFPSTSCRLDERGRNWQLKSSVAMR